MKSYFLVADIGGTHINFALIEVLNKKFKIKFEKKYFTSDFSSLSEVVNIFSVACFEKFEIFCDRGVFSCAGRVQENEVHLTNSNIIVSKRDLIERTRLRSVDFMNDFRAISLSVSVLPKNDLLVVNKGVVDRNSPIGVIGAGTGFGKSVVLPDGNILDSEIAHADFPFQNDEEMRLCNFIKWKKKVDRVEVEDVLSGSGIEFIYEFLCGNKKSAEEVSFLRYKDEDATVTFDRFYDFYARVAKGVAIDSLCAGGLFIAGGIAMKNMTFDKKRFVDVFCEDETFDKFLRRIPISVIKDYNCSLKGLGNYCAKKYC